MAFHLAIVLADILELWWRSSWLTVFVVQRSGVGITVHVMKRVSAFERRQLRVCLLTPLIPSRDTSSVCYELR